MNVLCMLCVVEAIGSRIDETKRERTYLTSAKLLGKSQTRAPPNSGVLLYIVAMVAKQLGRSRSKVLACVFRLVGIE